MKTLSEEASDLDHKYDILRNKYEVASKQRTNGGYHKADPMEYVYLMIANRLDAIVTELRGNDESSR